MAIEDRPGTRDHLRRREAEGAAEARCRVYLEHGIKVDIVDSAVEFSRKIDEYTDTLDSNLRQRCEDQHHGIHIDPMEKVQVEVVEGSKRQVGFIPLGSILYWHGLR